MSDVFVSYKAEDRRRVQPLVQALQADGLSVWWDEHIGAGDAWRETIERQLDTARCVLVVWSKRSVGPEGRFVRDEAARAQRRGVYVPVLIDAVDPPLGFGESQATSLRGWRGDRSDPRYEAVLAAVRRITGTKSSSAAATQEATQPAVSRRAVLVGGGVAAAGITGVGAWMLLKPGSSEASDSIAVLPFANLSGDPAQAYFSDGMAEELRSALARLGGLKVVARTSSEIVRNEEVTEAARKLKVANVLIGSVRLSQDVIRVATQLVDGRTGLEKWSQTYDRRAGDTLRIQADIAEKVAQALHLQLGRAEKLALESGGTNIPAAHDRYLQALAVFNSDQSEAMLRQSLQLLDEAIALDPGYARPQALKAVVLSMLTGAYSSASSDFQRGFAEAEAVARQAISLAPGSPDGHIALGTVLAGQLKFADALRQFDEAAAKGANTADFLISYGNFLAKLGASERALAATSRAVALDPLNPRAYLIQTGAYFTARRYEEALRSLNRVFALAPGHKGARQFAGDLLLLLGRIREAQEQYSHVPADDVFRLTSEAVLAARTGDRATSDERLRRIHQLHGDSANFQYAEIHAQRGETGLALAALEQALATRDPGVGWIKVSPYLDPIRSEPRFQALVRSLNFPEMPR